MKTFDQLIIETLPEKKVKEINKYTEDRSFSETLFILRSKSGITQSELARKAKCGQPKISKIEEKVDKNITLDDLMLYSKALNYNLEIHFHQRKTLMHHIQYHMDMLKNLFPRLTRICKGDQKMQQGAIKAIYQSTDQFLTTVSNQLQELHVDQEVKQQPLVVDVDSKEMQRANVEKPLLVK